MLALALSSIAFLPRVDAGAEIAHDLGLDDEIRATIAVQVTADLLQGGDWRLQIYFAPLTWVRSNYADESVVRISPQHINYPVGARLRFDLGGEATWGLYAFHRSDHGIDVDDAAQNEETLAFEVYGVEYQRPHLWVRGGLYYDRGTDRAGTPQTLPFRYYLFGATISVDVPLSAWAYAAGQLTAIAHRNGDHDVPYVNLAGDVEAGAKLRGQAADWRFFLRFERVEDYQFQGDTPRNLLLLGTGFGDRVGTW